MCGGGTEVATSLLEEGQRWPASLPEEGQRWPASLPEEGHVWLAHPSRRGMCGVHGEFQF